MKSPGAIELSKVISGSRKAAAQRDVNDSLFPILGEGNEEPAMIRVKGKRSSVRKKVRKEACNFIRDFDRFGTPIPLNYQGSDTYKTLPGSMLSLVAFALLAIGLAKSLGNLMNNKKWTMQEQLELIPFDELNTPVDLTKYPDFKVGFELKLSDDADHLTREEYLHHGRLLMKYFQVIEIGYSRNSSGFTKRQDKAQNNILDIRDSKIQYYGHLHSQNASEDLNSQNNLEYRIDLNNSILSGSESYNEDITNNYVSFRLQRGFGPFAKGVIERCEKNITCQHILMSNEQIFNELSAFYICTIPDKVAIQRTLDILKTAFESEAWDFFKFQYYLMFEVLEIMEIPPQLKNDPCAPQKVKVFTNNPCPKDNRLPEDGSQVPSKCLFTREKDELEKEINQALRLISIKPVVYDEITDIQDGDNEYPFQQRKAHSSSSRRKSFPLENDVQIEDYKFILRKQRVCLDNDIFAEFKVLSDAQNKCENQHDFEVIKVAEQRTQYIDPEGEMIVSITLLLDNQVSKTEVRSYKFYDLLADNGGFFEALLSLFALVGSPLSRLTFRYSVAQEAYYTRKSRHKLKEEYSGRKRESYLRNGLLNYADFKALFKRVEFTWLFKAVEPFFGCLLFPCCKSLYWQKRFIDEANDKFEDELNVIQLLKKVRLSTDLWTQSLSLDQKKSLKFSDSNVVVQRESTPWVPKMKKKFKKLRQLTQIPDQARKKKKKHSLSSSSSNSAESISFSISSEEHIQSSSSDFEEMELDLSRRAKDVQEINKLFQVPVLHSIPIPVYPIQRDNPKLDLIKEEIHPEPTQLEPPDSKRKRSRSTAHHKQASPKIFETQHGDGERSRRKQPQEPTEEEQRHSEAKLSETPQSLLMPSIQASEMEGSSTPAKGKRKKRRKRKSDD